MFAGFEFKYCLLVRPAYKLFLESCLEDRGRGCLSLFPGWYLLCGSGAAINSLAIYTSFEISYHRFGNVY